MCNKIKSSVIIGCQLSDIIAADTGNGTFKSICQSHSFIQPLFTHMSCIFSLNTTELLHIFYTKSELILGVSGLHIYLLVNTAVNSGNRIFSQDVSQQNLWSNELISGWTITSMFLCSKWRRWNNATLFVSSQFSPFLSESACEFLALKVEPEARLFLSPLLLLCLSLQGGFFPAMSACKQSVNEWRYITQGRDLMKVAAVNVPMCIFSSVCLPDRFFSLFEDKWASTVVQ